MSAKKVKTPAFENVEGTTVPQMPDEDISYEEVISECMFHYSQICEAMGGSVSLREMMWDMFAAIVSKHVAEYAVPQYGDYPADNMSTMSAEDCQKQISKYASRFGTNARGQEEGLLDLLKIAHYAGMAYMKHKDLESKFVLPSIDEVLDTAEKEDTNEHQR